MVEILALMGLGVVVLGLEILDEEVFNKYRRK
jgi:hypothetical protein